MDPKKLYLYALDEATKTIEQVALEHMDLPTPRAEWSVHELLQHVTYELAWTSDIVKGKTTTEVGDKYESEVLNGDLLDAWDYYETIVRSAVEECDLNGVAHLSYGDKTMGEYLIEAGNDHLVHAWDLGQVIGIKVIFNEVAAKQLYEYALARKEELLSSGLYAASVEVPESAPLQAKLLGLLGRSEHWKV